MLERLNYEPFGALIGKAGFSGVGYTGHVMDGGTGLTYMQQRYYDPDVGRFLSVDPVAVDTQHGANGNRYQYAANNPYRMVDPDGRNAESFLRPRDNPVKPDIDVKIKVEREINRFVRIAVEGNQSQLRGIGALQFKGAKLSVGTDGKGELKIDGLPYPLKFDLGPGALNQLQNQTRSLTLGA